jgi:prepilin-type N-terminal cleavage/methylation domain-containing protein
VQTALVNRRSGSTRRAPGFTLIELLAVLCIHGILMAALAMSFTSQLRSHRQQERMSEMQQTARAAMALITREARMAGYDPTGIRFSGITYDPDALRIQADLNGDGDVADANENVVYAYDAATRRLTRNTGGGRQSVAEQVETFAFEYRDANGLPTQVEQEIRELRVRITVRTAQPDPRYGQNGGYRTYTLESLITPPNLGL